MPYTKALIRGYLAVSTVLLVGMGSAVFGDTVESFISPVLTDIRPIPESIHRTAKKMCWGWTANKKRFSPLINIDVVMDDHGDLSFPEIIDSETGRVFHSNASRPAGAIMHNVCVDVPSTVKPQDAVKIHMRMHYAGFLPLWQVSAPYPDVDFPPLNP